MSEFYRETTLRELAESEVTIRDVIRRRKERRRVKRAKRASLAYMRVEGESERSERSEQSEASKASEASFTRLSSYMRVFPAEGTADYVCKAR